MNEASRAERKKKERKRKRETSRSRRRIRKRPSSIFKTLQMLKGYRKRSTVKSGLRSVNE